MRIGIGPYYYRNYGGADGARLMAEHGYSQLDFDLYANTDSELYAGDEAEFVAFTEGLRDKLIADGYAVWQIHGPWTYPPEDFTPEAREVRFFLMSRALHAASIIGAKYMAIHPVMPFGVGKHTPAEAEDLWRINIDFFTRLAAVGERYDVYVCLENMPFPDFPISSVEDIMRVVRAVDHPYLRVCLDTGHANVVKPAPADAVRLIGKEYLKILHVHGNDGESDHHDNPFDPRDTVDWQAFTDALLEIGFDGVVNLETSPRVSNAAVTNKRAVELALATSAKKIAGILPY